MSFFETLNDLITSGTPLVSVTVVDSAGSVPGETGAKMIVTSNGLEVGTVGGGKIEKRAIEEAQSMLAQGETTRFVQWQLNKDLGMTCGGALKLYFEAFNVAAWRIVIFGAGHVSNALVNVLLRLDCRITCIDPRSEWIERMPSSPRLETIVTSEMASMVPTLADDAFVLLMSSGHATDLPVLLEILRTRRFPFLGVIGSRAKANTLQRNVREAGLPPEAESAFICPVGLPLGTNHPQEIAISVAAQLLQARDRLRGTMRKWGR